MRDRQRDIIHAQLRREFPSFSVKRHRGPTTRHARDLTIAPADAVIPTRSQRLHCSFFRREAGGIAFESVGLGIAITNLSRRVDALEKPVSKSLDRLPDARNFSDVDACAYDHIQNNL